MGKSIKIHCFCEICIHINQIFYQCQFLSVLLFIDDAYRCQMCSSLIKLDLFCHRMIDVNMQGICGWFAKGGLFFIVKSSLIRQMTWVSSPISSQFICPILASLLGILRLIWCIHLSICIVLIHLCCNMMVEIFHFENEMDTNRTIWALTYILQLSFCFPSKYTSKNHKIWMLWRAYI